MEASLSVRVDVKPTGEVKELNLPPSTPVREVLIRCATITKVQLSDLLLVSPTTDEVLSLDANIGDYAHVADKLQVVMSFKAKVEAGFYGETLKLIAWKSEPSAETSPPALLSSIQQNGEQEVKAIEAIVPSAQLVLDTRAAVKGWKVVPLQPEEGREPLIPHVSLHVQGDKGNFDLMAFKRAVAYDLRVNIEDVAVLAVHDGGSYWIKFTLKVKQLEDDMQETRQKLKSKLDVFVHKINNKEATKVGQLYQSEAEFNGHFVAPVGKGEEYFDFRDYQEAVEMTELQDLHDPAAKAWMKEQDKLLETSVLTALQHCPQEFVIQRAAMILNEELMRNFTNRLNNGETSRLLYHGTNTKYYHSIFEKGFIYSGTTDDGWYGKGYYFTSFPQYALYYKHGLKDVPIEIGEATTLIASYVLLGRSFEVKDMSFKGKGEMQAGYNSHYVRVISPSFRPMALDPPETYKDQNIYDEYVVMETNRILPRFVLTLRRVDKLFVWRDKNIYNEENSAVLAALRHRGGFNLYATTESHEVIEIIEKKRGGGCKCFVISNGRDDGKGLVKRMRQDLGVDTPILIFCFKVEKHRVWASNYQDVQVTGSLDDVHKFVERCYHGN